MMRFAIVSNGPSDGLYTPTVGAYDVTIGVNKAVTDFPFHWWCFCDWNTYFTWHDLVVGHPRIFTKHQMPPNMERRIGDMSDPAAPMVMHKFLEEQRAGRVLLTNEIGHPKLARHTPRWDSYSGVMAFLLAWYLADASDESSIDCYDFDMKSDVDRKGHRNATRTDNRWNDERTIYDSIMAFFALERIAVYRIGPNGRVRENAHSP